jgi:H+/gluconate symporter-like permease
MIPTASGLITVERTIQLAIAPVCLLGSIMSALMLLTGRRQSLADREIESLPPQPALP